MIVIFFLELFSFLPEEILFCSLILLLFLFGIIVLRVVKLILDAIPFV